MDLAHLVLKPTAMSIRQYYWEIIKLYYKVTMEPGMFENHKKVWPLGCVEIIFR